MKFCYTYCSNNGKNLPSKDFFAKMAKLSVVSLGNCVTAPIELYADNAAADWFIDREICFDRIHIIDFNKYKTDSRYWNFGKIVTYSEQNESFLHIDFDTVFFPGFSVPEADIVTESLRDYSLHIDFLRHEIPGYPVPAFLICSGLIGCGNGNKKTLEVFKKLKTLASVSCSSEANKYKSVSNENLIGIEEFALTQLAEEEKLTVAELDKNFYAHWQGEDKEKRFGALIDQLYNNFGCNTDWMTL